MVSNTGKWISSCAKLVSLEKISEMFCLDHHGLMQDALPMLEKIKDKGGQYEIVPVHDKVLGTVFLTLVMDKKSALYVASGVSDEFRWELIEYVENIYNQKVIYEEALDDVEKTSVDPKARKIAKEAKERAKAIEELKESRSALKSAIAKSLKERTFGRANNQGHAEAKLNIVICENLTGKHTDAYKDQGGYPESVREGGKIEDIKNLSNAMKEIAKDLIEGFSFNLLRKRYPKK